MNDFTYFEWVDHNDWCTIAIWQHVTRHKFLLQDKNCHISGARERCGETHRFAKDACVKSISDSMPQCFLGMTDAGLQGVL